MPNSPGIRTRSWSLRAPRGDRTGNAGASRGGSPAAERRVRRRAILLVAGRVFLVMLGRGSGRPLYAGEQYARGGSGEIKTSDVREQCEGEGRIEARCTAASHAEGRLANSRITNEGNEIVFGDVSCPGRYARTREAPFTLLFLGNLEGVFGPSSVLLPSNFCAYSHPGKQARPLTHLTDRLTRHVAHSAIQPRQGVERIRRVKDVCRGFRYL